MKQEDTNITNEFSCVKAGFKVCNFCSSNEFTKFSLPLECWVTFFEKRVDELMQGSSIEDMIDRLILWKTERFDQKTLLYLDYVLNKYHKNVWIRIQKVILIK